MAYITDDKVKKITDLSTASSLIGDEKIPSQKGNNAYGLSLSRVGGFAVRGTCSTAAGTQDKVVTLTGYTGTEIPSLISVTFTKANTFGDCTASPATYPRLIVQNSAGVTIATLNVCDARGHTAGTGCWNAGDKMRFNIELNSSNTGDALIDNSDIRQQTSTMTIKADGFFKRIEKQTYIGPVQSVFGSVFISSNIDFQNLPTGTTDYYFEVHTGNYSVDLIENNNGKRVNIVRYTQVTDSVEFQIVRTSYGYI